MASLTTSAKFDWLDAVMADHQLSARAKVVAYGIARHLNLERGDAFVSDPTVSDKTGVPLRRVADGRNELRDRGWIHWKRTRTANLYTLLDGQITTVRERQEELTAQRKRRRSQTKDRTPSTDHDLHPPTDHDLTPLADLNSSALLPSTEQVLSTGAEQVLSTGADIHVSSNTLALTLLPKSPAMMTTLVPTDFDEFWKTYPRRVERSKAEKVYNAAIKSNRATVEELLAGAKRYAAERAGQDPTYTKHPATWLNGGCWMDEPTQKPQIAKPTQADTAIAGMRRFLNRENLG